MHKVLVIGSGGREHALIWKLSQSPKVTEIYCVPGNGGTTAFSSNFEVNLSNWDELLLEIESRHIDLVVIGPEDPLVAGLVDFLAEEDITVFGPCREAAKLEGSKSFCRDVCEAAGVRMAEGRSFQDYDSALSFLEQQSFPYVIKADGLAQGKGVVIAENLVEAKQALSEIMCDKKFGQAGNKVVLEEFLKGYEISLLAICSGEDHLLLDAVQDHKQIFDHDKGPNTGGMGTYSPVPAFTEDKKQWVRQHVVQPILAEMKQRGAPFRGCLFIGLMVCGDDIRVLELNVRFGDPETQSVLMRLEGDFYSLLYSAARGEKIEHFPITWKKEACVTVVAASKGYPGTCESNKEIKGDIESEEGIQIFHAGTKIRSGHFVTHGGRVFAVSALGRDIADARDHAYSKLSQIHFDGMQYRTDIGLKSLNLQEK